MKVKYYMDKVDENYTYPAVESDLYCLEMDCIRLLLLGLDSGDASALEVELDKSEVSWWLNVSRVEGKGEELAIYTPESYNNEHVLIKRSQLKKIIADWKIFLKNKQPIERGY